MRHARGNNLDARRFSCAVASPHGALRAALETVEKYSHTRGEVTRAVTVGRGVANGKPQLRSSHVRCPCVAATCTLDK